MSDSKPPSPHHETQTVVAALGDSALRRTSSAAISQGGQTCAGSGAVQVLSVSPATPRLCMPGSLEAIPMRPRCGFTKARGRHLQLLLDGPLLELAEEIASHFEPALRATGLNRLRVEYKIKKNFVRDLPPS